MTTDIEDLIPRNISTDIRQEVLLALIDADEMTAEEAEVIIRRVVNHEKYVQKAWRTRVEDLDFNSTYRSPSADRDKQAVSALLNLLDQETRDVLIDSMYLPVAECARKHRISQPTWRKRLADAQQRARLVAVKN